MHDLLERIHPRIIDVFHRDPAFWRARGHLVVSNPTKLRSLLYVYDGQGDLELDGISNPLNPGCAFQIPIERHLRLHSSPERPLCYYTVQYDFKLIDWEGTGARCSEPEDTMLPLGLVISMAEPESLHDRMRKLFELWQAKKPGFSAKARLAFLQLLMLVGEQQNVQLNDDAARQAILQCTNYIRSHYSDQLEREALAQMATLSPSYFSIVFKKHAGCSPVQYITRVRLDKARQLLRESGKSVTEVAMEVGYRDPLYFTRVFTREIGVSPREYRNT